MGWVSALEGPTVCGGRRCKEVWLGEQDEGGSGGLELPGRVPDSTGGGAFGDSPWEEVASGLGFEPRGELARQVRAGPQDSRG